MRIGVLIVGEHRDQRADIMLIYEHSALPAGIQCLGHISTSFGSQE